MSEYTKILMNELIHKSLEGEISEEENRALNDFVSKPENVEYYLKSLRLHESLKSRASLLSDNNMAETSYLGLKELAFYERTAPAVELPEEKPQQELIQKVIYPAHEKYKMSKFSIFSLVATAAAVLFIVLLTQFVPVNNQDIPSDIQYQAVITDSFNAQWADTAKPADIGSEINSGNGDRWLQSGYVKMLFASGAEVVIESPARFEILSENEMNLFSGRAYSKVPQRARGFTIATPSSKVIDLGTEFGVEVRDGSSSVHMIQGKASLLPQNRLHTQKSIELIAGYAKAVDRDGIATDIRKDDEKFISDFSSKMQMIYRGDKAISVGTWEQHLSPDLKTDLRTDGNLIRAINFGPESMVPATVCGISFEPSVTDEFAAGGKKLLLDNNDFLNDSNRQMEQLLGTSRVLNNSQNTSIRLDFNDLQIGKIYRIQLVFGFSWEWCDVNCYGTNNEHMYFPNTNKKPEVGLASYRWKAQATHEEIVLTSPRKTGEWNQAHLFGYVLHEVGEND